MTAHFRTSNSLANDNPIYCSSIALIAIAADL
jgi:hypothetical protein